MSDLPIRMTFAMARVLSSYCRDFHFGELVESGMPIGVYVITHGLDLPQEAKITIREIVMTYGTPLRTVVRFFSREDLI